MDYLGADAEVADDPLEKGAGVFLGLGGLDGPSHDGPVIQVDDRIGVEEYPYDVGLDPGDVPCPDLVGAGDGDSFRLQPSPWFP